ncbi:MAG: STAS domain-containing protein [Planctomycetota bacterium]
MSIKMVSIEDDGVAVLACDQELDGLALSSQDNSAMQKVLGEKWSTKRVALDLSATQYIDSATIGWLLSTHKHFNEGGGRVVLHGMQPSVKRVIEMMRIHQVLELVADREQAMARLRETP